MVIALDSNYYIFYIYYYGLYEYFLLYYVKIREMYIYLYNKNLGICISINFHFIRTYIFYLIFYIE